MSLIAERYAEALLDVSIQRNKIENFEKDLEGAADIYGKLTDFRLVLSDPRTVNEIRKRILIDIFKEQVAEEILNFLLLLVDKGRITYLPQILKVFKEMADRARNVINMEIVSAAPLQEMLILKIKEKFMKIYRVSNIKETIKVDKSLIGGVLVRIGDRVYDGTAKGMLERMKKNLAAS